MSAGRQQRRGTTSDDEPKTQVSRILYSSLSSLTSLLSSGSVSGEFQRLQLDETAPFLQPQGAPYSLLDFTLVSDFSCSLVLSSASLIPV